MRQSLYRAPEEEPRPGTVRQSVMLTYQPALVKMLAGLDYLAGYQYGCTEQRISQLMPELALKDLLDQIGRGDRAEASDLSMRETFTFLDECAARQTGYTAIGPAPTVMLA